MLRHHVDELYTAYLEGSLPNELRRRVDAHLRACPRCAAELAAMRTLVTALHDLPAPAAPSNLAAGVRARLRQPARPRLRWATGLALAGLLAALAAAVVMPRWLPRPTGASLQVTQATDTGKRAMPPAKSTGGARHALPSPSNPRPAVVRMQTQVGDPFKGSNDGANDGKVKPAVQADRAGHPAMPVPPAPLAPRALPAPDEHAAGNDPDATNSPPRYAATTKSVEPATVARGMSSTAVAAPPGATATTVDDSATKPTDGAPPAAPGVRATTGSLNLNAISAADAPSTCALQPSWSPGKVQMRVTTPEEATVVVTAGKSARTYAVKPPETVFAYDADAGSVTTLCVQTKTTPTAYFFVTPAKSSPKAGAPGARMTALELLQYWASATGNAVLCPSLLAQGSAALTFDPAHPLDSLQAYAAQHGATAALTNGVAVLAPKR